MFTTLHNLISVLNEHEISRLYELGLETIRDLEVDNGVLASGREEIFGCIFGRDSLIVCLKLLSAYHHTREDYFRHLAKKILLNLADLQGTAVNIESGEEPGKMIHEYRPDNHDHLTRNNPNPWYVYPDGAMRIYDSVDGTPLFLMAVYRYVEITGDAEVAHRLIPNVRAGLEWLMTYGDSDKDGFVDYELNPLRKHGGLKTQSWMDSGNSAFHEDGTPVAYPVAPVEVQAYAYAALRMWSDYFTLSDPAFSVRLSLRADELKARFNVSFVQAFAGAEFEIACAVDGNAKPLVSTRSSIGHILWAAWKRKDADRPDSILKAEYVPRLAERLLAPDLFEPKAGIRTLSSQSPHFNPLSYHNGSIWPHDTGMIAEGLEKCGYASEAQLVREALLWAMLALGSPYELITVVDGTVRVGEAENGQKACTNQAWSAATLLAELLAYSHTTAMQPSLTGKSA